MTCIVQFNTKKGLKEAVKNSETVNIQDPSIIAPRFFNTSDMRVGEKVVVTNHPKRSYFAAIYKTEEGVIVL